MDTKTISPANSAELQAGFDVTGAGKKYEKLVIEGSILIDEPVYMNSGTYLYGIDATLNLMNSAPTKVFKGDPDGQIVPIIGQKEATIKNVTIEGLEFYGNKEKQNVLHGKNYHNFIYFTNASDIVVKSCYIHDSQGDGLRFRDSARIIAYDNIIHYIGHDGLHYRNCTDLAIYKNVIRCRINSGVRLINCTRAQVKGNIITGYLEPGKTAWSRGGPGIQMDRSEAVKCEGIEIYENLISNTYGPGILLSNYGPSTVGDTAIKIRNNVITQCGQHEDTINWVGGIIGAGWNAEILDNTLYGNYRYGIAIMVGNTIQGTTPKGNGYQMKVTNNIIANTALGLWKTNEATGYGVANLLPDTHKVICRGNNVNASAFAAFRSVDWDSSNINVDPLFADPGKDFHLKSAAGRFKGLGFVLDTTTSPCIYADSECGRYNGTDEASKPVAKPIEPEKPKIEEFTLPSVMLVCDSPEALQTLIEAIISTGKVGSAGIVVFNVPAGFAEVLNR